MKTIPRVLSKRPKVGNQQNLGSSPIGVNHPDALAVDRFAATMKAKLAQKRAEGRGGWQDKELCSGDFLSQLLREHVEKGDPVDVANFCMMLHQRGERISPSPQPKTLVDQARVSGFAEGIERAAKIADEHAADFERQAGGKEDPHAHDALLLAADACELTADAIRSIMGGSADE